MNTSIIEDSIKLMTHTSPSPPAIWCVITVRNASLYIEKCIKSILAQSCISKVKIAICDDASTDGTREIVDTLITQSCNPQDIFYIKNKERKYKLRNIMTLMNTAPIDVADVCCFIDGDDWLTNETSLQTVIDKYMYTGCWVTYGSYKSITNDDCCCRNMTSSEKESNDFRNMPWMFSHLFTFRYFLWKSIPESYFVFDEDVLYEYTADIIINLPILELAKSSRIQYISERIYGYNDINELNDNKVSEQKQLYVDNKIRRLSPVKNTIFPCYDYVIIIPYRKRFDNLRITYESVRLSIENTSLRIHCIVCENSESPEADMFCKENQIEYMYMPIGNMVNMSMFNKSLTFDISVLFGLPSRGYVCHDVDIFIPKDFWQCVEVNRIHQGVKVLQTFAERRINYLNEESTAEIHGKKKKYSEVTDADLSHKGYGAWGGSIYIDRDVYFKIGGYDSWFFSGHSPEDQSIITKINQKDYKIGFCNSPAIELYHQWHENVSTLNKDINIMIQIWEYMKGNKEFTLQYIKDKHSAMDRI
jgi:glycosyltransferase involved in cell wall biosynthesis